MYQMFTLYIYVQNNTNDSIFNRSKTYNTLIFVLIIFAYLFFKAYGYFNLQMLQNTIIVLFIRVLLNLH